MELPHEMYVMYVTRRANDHQTLSQALTTNDVSSFKKIGHQMKGNASTFGFDELVGLAKRMEAIDDKNIGQNGPPIVEELKSWVTIKTQEYKVNL